MLGVRKPFDENYNYQLDLMDTNFPHDKRFTTNFVNGPDPFPEVNNEYVPDMQPLTINTAPAEYDIPDSIATPRGSPSATGIKVSTLLLA